MEKVSEPVTYLTFFLIFDLNLKLMRKHIHILLCLLFCHFLISCKSAKPLISSSETLPASKTTGHKDLKMPPAGTPESNYINRYKDAAIYEMKRTGIPASITLAQGMLESDYGRSRLAREGNNHFGIKCHNWDGDKIYHDDNLKNDCFRKYNNVQESFHDHSEFIRAGSRYKFLFDYAPGDYKSWAYGLKKAGYATNPDYPGLLIRKIEQYNLDAFDREYSAERKSPPQTITKKAESINVSDITADNDLAASPGNETIMARTPRIMENNRIQYIIVKDGDTREKMEKEFGLLKWELPKYNELRNDFIPVPGQVLYLQPKRDKAGQGNTYYTVAKGDTMYLISQKFGVKLKRLYEMNRMREGVEPGPGSKIWLRSMKPVS